MMAIAEVNAHLASYEGGKGRLWAFTPSHDRLAVALSSAGDERRVFLVLLGCIRLKLPTAWRLHDPSISTEGSTFVFADGDVRVEFAYEFQLSDTYGE